MYKCEYYGVLIFENADYIDMKYYARTAAGIVRGTTLKGIKKLIKNARGKK